MIIEAWDKLHTSEQVKYVEWVMTLVTLGRIPKETDEELMQKAIRMHKCDVHQGELWEL
jgi:hypothetical protein